MGMDGAQRTRVPSIRKGTTPSQAIPSYVSRANAGGISGRKRSAGTGQCRKARSVHRMNSAQGRCGSGQGRCRVCSSGCVAATFERLAIDRGLSRTDWNDWPPSPGASLARFIHTLRSGFDSPLRGWPRTPGRVAPVWVRCPDLGRAARQLIGRVGSNPCRCARPCPLGQGFDNRVTVAELCRRGDRPASPLSSH